MIYRVGVNDIEQDHWCAWAFDLHGCFAKGRTREEAIALVSQAIREYGAWRSRHDQSYRLPDDSTNFEVVEDIRSWWSGDYFANAFFEDDKRPLTSGDVNTIRQLLAFTRNDLNEVIDNLSSSELDAAISGEVWGSIRGVLNHIATAEWWYLTRIDLISDWDILPEDILHRLDFVRVQMLQFLTTLVEQTKVYEKRDELWNGRKVLRRALWHEIAHTKQIQRYLRG